MIDQNKKYSSANLIINNIGNLGKADITIDNNCVIAGHNNIGKSTITKILFSIIKGVTLGDKIYEDFMNKIENLNEEEQILEIRKLQQKHTLLRFYNLKIFIVQLKHDLYLNYVTKYLHSTLGMSIIRFYENVGYITFKCNEFELTIDFINKGIVQLKYKGVYDWYKDATLISSTEILNYSNLINMADTVITEEFNKAKLISAQDKDLIDKLNTDFIDMLDENFNIIEGLGFDKLGYAFYKENGNEIQMKMLGTGKKLFVMIDKLLKNKSINSDTLVMLDEPEEGMHPEWQLEFIEKLFKINVPFALTTHSPYIIQSLIYNAKKDMKEIEYYTVEHFRDLGYAESKKELKPLNIVKDLTNPILKVRGF